MKRKSVSSILVLSHLLFIFSQGAALADPPGQPRRMGQLTPAEQQSAADRNQALIDLRNAAMALPQLVSSNPSVELEASYILACQFLNPDDAAHGAINNVYGAPTWIVPRENALAILQLVNAASLLDDEDYLDRADMAIEYLLGVQDADGAWFDQYDYSNPFLFSKSPTQTAETMIALYAVGYKSQRYGAMKKAAEFLLACQDVANKGGLDDGLLGGGKDASGNFISDRWVSDNSFAYQALKAAQNWAIAEGDFVFAEQCFIAAARIVNGINEYFYINDAGSADYGVWHRVIDQDGNALEPGYKEWINYAPQLLDLPVTGFGDERVGEWIHDNLQLLDGSVVWDNGPHSTRSSPGFSFQAAMVWFDLGQHDYLDAAVEWAVSSGLWAQLPDSNGVSGGWIDWTEPGDEAPFWQRFIDTSFYATAAFTGGYDFLIQDALNTDLLFMALQDDADFRAAFNALYGTQIGSLGTMENLSQAERDLLASLGEDPELDLPGFVATVKKAGDLYAWFQTSPSDRANFDLLFGTTLPASGTPTLAQRTALYRAVAHSAYTTRAAFLSTLQKSATLYVAVRGNATHRGRFNLIFGNVVPASGPLASPDQGLAFVSIAAAPGYVQANFLTQLSTASTLFTAIRGNATHRARFNLVFGATIPAAGASTSMEDGFALLKVVSQAGYAQAAFLTQLGKAAALYPAIQADAALRGHFERLYGAIVPASGASSSVTGMVLIAIVTPSAYVQATYLSQLSKAGSLYEALQSTGLYFGYNRIFGTTLPASGVPNAADRNSLFATVTPATYSQAVFLSALMRAEDSLYELLQSDAALRAKFNLLYNTTIPASGPPSAAARAILLDVTDDAGYDETTFLYNLNNAYAVYTTHRANATMRANFNLMYGTSIAATGVLSAANRAKLFTAVTEAYFDPATFAAELAQAAAFYKALQASATLRGYFNIINVSAVPATGAPSASDRTKIFGIVLSAEFNQTSYMAALNRVGALYKALQTTAANRNAFNLLFGSAIAGTGSPSVADRTVLYNLTGDPAYVQAAFLAALPKAAALYSALQSAIYNRLDFNLLFGATVPDAGSPGASDRKAMFDVVGGAGYAQASFLASLPKAADLYEVLLQDAALRDDFNFFFASTIAGSGPLSGADRKTLFDATADALFTVPSFIEALDRSLSLYAQLQIDALHRSNFNSLYGTAVQPSGSPAAFDRNTILEIAADPNFNEAGLLGALPKALNLYVALKANATQRTAFNVLFGTTFAATGGAKVKDAKNLFDVTGDPGYDQTAFLPVLVRAGNLWTAIRGNTTHNANFDLLFGTTLPASGSPSAADRGTIFNVAGAPTFNQTSFLAVLAKAGPLYSALKANATRRGYFNLLYGSSIAASGPLSDADRTILFDTAGGSGFAVSSYLPVLDKAGYLYVQLQSNASKRAKFNAKYGASVPAAGSPNAATRGKIFNIAGGSTYTFSGFWASLG